MVMSKLRSPRIVCSLAALGVAMLVSACGGGSSTSSSAPATTTQAAAVSSTTSAAPKPRLRTLSPRAGSHIGSNVTVRVALVNARTSGPRPFRYVLDGVTRFGPRRLVFHGVRPGNHRLVVTLVDDRSVRSQTAFVVKAPPPPPPVVTTTTPAPAPAPTTTAAPAPTTPAPTPTTPTAAPPPPTTSTTTAAPPPTTTSPPSGGGIPQGGGGDGDGDNSGAPSDGDGNI